MKKLPSELERELQENLLAVQQLQDGEKLVFSQDCDCGSQIRHNNGGNYHDTVVITRDKGQLFAKRETTCELVAAAEWEEVLPNEVEELIREVTAW